MLLVISIVDDKIPFFSNGVKKCENIKQFSHYQRTSE